MAKDFNGGISEAPFELLMQTLTTHQSEVAQLLIALARVEHNSSQVDVAALRGNPVLCTKVKAQRLAVEAAIGPGIAPTDLTRKIQQNSRDLQRVNALVTDLDASLKLVADHTHVLLGC